MKQNYKKYEEISAYLDDELSSEQNERLKKEIQSDDELKKVHSEIGKIKELVSGIKPLPEDNYFEHRVMENLKDEKESPFSFNTIKKPVIAFSLLTLFFMVFWKYNPDFFDKFISEQQTNIIDFYTENLQPLIFAGTLTNEDIFNFAMNKELPLNKENNQLLSISKDEYGNEVFEIKYAGNASGVLNLESFVRSLNLNEKQKNQVDSILESYTDEISTQVLVNDKNIVAVNPNILNYRNAIKSDLISFAANTNSAAVKQILPANFEVEQLRNFSKSIISAGSKDENIYCFIAPDTIFFNKIEINKDELKREMEKFKEEMKTHQKEIKVLKRMKFDVKVFPPDSILKHGLKIWTDSNQFRIVIPEILIPDVELPNFDSIDSELNKALLQLKDLNISIKMDSLFNKKRMSIKIHSDSLKNFDFKFDPDSIRGLNFNFNEKDFNVKNLDSLGHVFKQFFTDSSRIIFPKDFNFELDEFKKEMEYLRKEMEQLRRELKNKNKDNETKNLPIEI
ncbi:MAG TPA: hypothetical protein PK397_04495 [Ignavibacteriaceae bacterium]|nr:hypothetical protein [Ignavibacteriaceae bacterium]